MIIDFTDSEFQNFKIIFNFSYQNLNKERTSSLNNKYLLSSYDIIYIIVNKNQ